MNQIFRSVFLIQTFSIIGSCAQHDYIRYSIMKIKIINQFAVQLVCDDSVFKILIIKMKKNLKFIIYMDK